MQNLNWRHLCCPLWPPPKPWKLPRLINCWYCHQETVEEVVKSSVFENIQNPLPLSAGITYERKRCAVLPFFCGNRKSKVSLRRHATGFRLIFIFPSRPGILILPFQTGLGKIILKQKFCLRKYSWIIFSMLTVLSVLPMLKSMSLYIFQWGFLLSKQVSIFIFLIYD